MKKKNNIYIKSLLLLVVAVVMGVANLWAQEGSGNWKKNTPTSGNNTRKSSLMVPENSATVNRPLPNPGNPPAVEPDPVQDNNTSSVTITVDCEETVFFEDFGTSPFPLTEENNFGRTTSIYMPNNSFKFGTPYPTSTEYDEYMIDNDHYAVVAPGYIKGGTDSDPNHDNNRSTIVVTPVNTTNAVDDFAETDQNTPVSGNVLNNDYDLEEHTQTVSDPGTHQTEKGGSITIDADGSYTYTPPTSFRGLDQFEYRVCDNGTPRACDKAFLLIGVGICAEKVVGESFDGWGGGPYSFTQPGTNYGFVLDIYKLDNSFNMEINGTKIAVNEIEFQPLHEEMSPPTLGVNVEFADGDKYLARPQDWNYPDSLVIYNMTGTVENPVVRVIISPRGSVTLWGSKESGGPLFPLVLTENTQGPNRFNNINWKTTGTNEITVTQHIVGSTHIYGRGYGQNIAYCGETVNYWMGGTPDKENDWNEPNNWTANYIPEAYEDIEFATVENYGKAAVDDLYVPEGITKKIGSLINETKTDGNSEEQSLVIPPNSGLYVYENVIGSNDNADKIIVQADEEEATGTLWFPNAESEDNEYDYSSVQATVEFYNQAYDCKDCGYFTRSWQYFGIPVSESGFPYLSQKVETINEWMENVDGNKWVAIGTNNLKAFRGYEITNSSTTKPDHIYSFQGKLNIGDATVGLTKTTTSAVNYSGMNLIANSFTAAIPIDKNAIKYNDGTVADAVYLFNTGTRDQWRKLNGGNVPNVVSGTYTSVPLKVGGQAGLPNSIPSMHTFMVEAKSNTNIYLIYSELVKNEVKDGQPAWRSAEQNDKQEIPHIVLDVIGTQSADRVWLFEQHGTTRGFDNGWDGVKMPEKDIVQIYVVGEDAKENYQVATVPQLVGTAFGLNTVNTVETGHALSNQSQSQLQLHMAVSPDVEIRGLYLRDMLTGRSYALKNGAEYRVSGSISSDNRFKVVDNALDESKLSDNPLIDIYVQDNQVVVANNSEEDCTVSLFDISGRLVAKRAVASSGTTYVSTAISGVYVVKVIGGTVNESKRVVVK